MWVEVVGWMVVVVEVKLFVGEQVIVVVDFVVDKILVAEGIVVGMAENIVTDNVGNMVEQMMVYMAGIVVEKIVYMAGIVVEKIVEEKNILSILVVGIFVVVG